METIFETDSYKWTHAKMYPEGTQGVYSYLEARKGARHPATVFFGLQTILKKIAGAIITQEEIDKAQFIADIHLGPGIFNREGWQRVVDVHGGKLPLRIKAVPEGTLVPVGNVLMTVENTDSQLYWLTNALESLLLHVWYPTTVCTVSYFAKQMMKSKLEKSADSLDALPFMLHDFGYRGATSEESAARAGAAHLVNFMGTDTIVGMMLALYDYSAKLKTLAFSVPATEHSVMTSLGETGEFVIVRDLIEEYPTGILSVVADSFNINRFVDEIGTTFKDKVMARDGKFVIRPDSVEDGDTAEDLVLRLVSATWRYFGGTFNSKGYKVLDPHIGFLWGDGLQPAAIEKILDKLIDNGFSAENIVFGMGGGLHQKDIDRDTERWAFKSSAQLRNGVWVEIQKNPLDKSKASKKGRLALVKGHGLGFSRLPGKLEGFMTIPEGDPIAKTHDVLQVVFENGELFNEQNFEDIRARAV